MSNSPSRSERAKGSSRQSLPVPFVIGGGGMRGPCAVGAMERLAADGVVPSACTGVSIGSVVSAMTTSGRTASDMKHWFLNGTNDFGLLIKSLMPPLNPLRHLAGGVIDLKPAMQLAVDRFELVANENLQVLAFDLLSRKPVIFSGEDYDLAVALAASCSIPFIFRPVPCQWRGKSYLLVDGGVYHPHPGEFFEEPSIVIKLLDSPIHADRRRDLKIDAGKPGASFLGRLREEDWFELIGYGYDRADEALSVSGRKLESIRFDH